MNKISLHLGSPFSFWRLGPCGSVLIIFFLGGGVSLNAHDPKGKVPPVELVQARLWQNMRLQDFTLEGFVRTTKKLYPITLRTKDRVMVYEFKDQPLQLRVTLHPEQTVVEKRTDRQKAWEVVGPGEKIRKILDSDMTYEDLSLDFFRWEHVEPLGTDSIKTLPAWLFEAQPSAKSNYSKVRYWISSEYFAFLRIDGYNAKNQVIKRVEINGIAEISQAVVLKEMQISTMIPGRDISESRTYIEVRSGQKGSGL